MSLANNTRKQAGAQLYQAQVNLQDVVEFGVEVEAYHF